MFIGGFLLRVVVLENTTLLQKPSQFSLFFGEGIVIQLHYNYSTHLALALILLSINKTSARESSKE